MKYFLGEAANYSKKATFCQLFAHGRAVDSANLRKFLASRYGAPQTRVLLYPNGRTALAAGIKALVPKNSQIIVNGFTCQAVVEAVRAANCVPVYADINPKTLHFDCHSLARTLQKYPNAKAIIVQNTLGIPADSSETSSGSLPRLFSYARRHNLTVIEDLAHSAGRFYQSGSECGQLGAASILSFGKGKAIDCINGGALILRSNTARVPRTAQRPQRISDSLRARFYPLFAAVARVLTPSIFAKLWLGALIKLHFIERSADAKIDFGRRLSHWQAKLALHQLQALPANPGPLRDFRLVKDRPALLKDLAAQSYYFSEIWYDCPISPRRNYQKWHFPEAECPVATSVAQQIINLPTIYSPQALAPALKIIKKYEISPATQNNKGAKA